jgi:hypothetical protein
MKNQKGMTLIIVLIFMLVLALLAFSASRSSTIQTKISGNEKDKTVSRLAAEDMLRQVENMMVQDDFVPPVAPNKIEGMATNKLGTSVQVAEYKIYELDNNLGCTDGKKYSIYVLGYGGRSTTKTELEQFVCLK